MITKMNTSISIVSKLRPGRHPGRSRNGSFWIFILRSWLWLSIIASLVHFGEAEDNAVGSGTGVEPTKTYVLLCLVGHCCSN